MQGIKLKNNGSFDYIIAPSGKRAQPNKLKVGQAYLHQNLQTLRKITEITITHVFYEQGHRLGCCSKKSFVILCPNEATEQEITFLEGLH